MTPTLVTFVLDKSGSMSSCFDATVEAFNAYIKELKNGDPDAISFSLVQFDTMSIETTWKNAPLSDVTGLSRDNYNPNGGTPLIDAAYKAILATEKRANELGGAPKVIICIQTDGEENSSTQHTWDELTALIKEKTALGWQFNFMGVGLDAYNQSARMGISRGSTVSYDAADLSKTRAAFRASGANAQSFSLGQSLNTEYSAKQKADAGDTIDISVKHDYRVRENPDGTLKPPKVVSRTLSRTPRTPIVDDIDL